MVAINPLDGVNQEWMVIDNQDGFGMTAAVRLHCRLSVASCLKGRFSNRLRHVGDIGIGLVLRRCLDAFDQFGIFPGLGQITEHFGIVYTALDGIMIGKAGEQYAHGGGRLSLELVQQFMASHFRHSFVTDDHVDLLLADILHRLRAVGSKQHVKMGPAGGTDRFQYPDFIIDKQDSWIHSLLTTLSNRASPCLTGILIVKVDPLPGVDSTSMDPPWLLISL